MNRLDNIEDQIRALSHGNVLVTRREVKLLPEALLSNERVCGLAVGRTQGTTYTIFLTNQRILMLKKGLLWGIERVEIPLQEIKTIASRTGWLMGKITLSLTGTNKIIDQIINPQLNSFIEALNAQIHQLTMSEVVNGPASQDFKKDQQGKSNLFSELENLASMRDNGKITLEEFYKKKDDLLSA